MLQYFAICVAKCLESIWNCLCKLFYRIRLYYYLHYLDEMKRIELAKAKKQYLQQTGCFDNQLCQILFFPIIWVYVTIKGLWVTVTTLFVADKYVSCRARYHPTADRL